MTKAKLNRMKKLVVSATLRRGEKITDGLTPENVKSVKKILGKRGRKSYTVVTTVSSWSPTLPHLGVGKPNPHWKKRKPTASELKALRSMMLRSRRLNQYGRDIHAYAKSKGWWEKPRNVGELLALLHSEISEALEEYRRPGEFKPDEIRFVKGKPEGFGIELADLFIRLMDMSGAMGIDMEKMVEVKMAYNEKRPYRHGNKKA